MNNNISAKNTDITKIKSSGQQHLHLLRLMSMKLQLFLVNRYKLFMNLNMEGFHGANRGYKNFKGVQLFTVDGEEDVER
jgi:hypothetical protein